MSRCSSSDGAAGAGQRDRRRGRAGARRRGTVGAVVARRFAGPRGRLHHRRDLGTAIYLGAAPLSRAYTTDSKVAAAAATLLSIVAFYHLADAVQAVMAQVLRG